MTLLIACFIACGPEAITPDPASPAPASDDEPAPASLEPTEHPGMARVDWDDRLAVPIPVLGELVFFDPATLETEAWYLGHEPTRVALLNGLLYVTLRAGNQLKVLDASGSSRVIPTGAEPYGIVAMPERDSVMVAVSREGRVVERTSDGDEVRNFRIDGEPRWLARHPSLDSLYVATAYGQEILWIDGDELPVGFPFPDLVSERDGEIHALQGRVTGDPVVSPDGTQLLAPALFVDPSPDDDPDLYAAGGGATPILGRFLPALVTWDLDRGEPHSPRALWLGTDLDPGVTARSYPSSVQADPGGEIALVSMEASDAVLAVPLRPIEEPSEELGGWVPVPRVHLKTLRGPRATALLPDDTLWIHCGLDHAVARVDPAAVRRMVQYLMTDSPTDPDDVADASYRLDSTSVHLQLTSSALDPRVAQGRSLFTSALNSEVASPSAGVSCSTCHFEGRSDGTVWSLPYGDRVTKSLAGQVSRTPPFTWTLGTPSIEHEAAATSKDRMGGSGLDHGQAIEVAAWIDYTRRPSPPTRVLERDVKQGEDLFLDDALGCADCHPPPGYTDGKAYALATDEPITTPSLLGVGARGPYFHDGRSLDLFDVLEDPWMSTAFQLSAEEQRQLVVFLQSL